MNVEDAIDVIEIYEDEIKQLRDVRNSLTRGVYIEYTLKHQSKEHPKLLDALEFIDKAKDIIQIAIERKQDSIKTLKQSDLSDI